MIWSTDPSKNVSKILPPPPKLHDKTIKSNILWLNLNRINKISFLQSALKQGNPHFIFKRRAQNADTHALKQHRLSQNIFPVCSSFVLVVPSDMHLHFHTTKNIQIQSTLFRYF